MFIQGQDLAEALLEDEDLNVEKRFETTVKDLTIALENATNDQQTHVYNLWQSSLNMQMYKVLKNIGVKPRAKE
jgi:hypothetical protein|tara:strand:- start:1085 stop:1306 length:222 start_codon:yes stop_codon:yes gene_type:complete